MNRLFPILLFLVLALPQSQLFSGETKNQNDDVVAIVNGKKITKDVLINRMKNFVNTDPETLSAIKQEIIDQLITDTLLEEFIDKQGLVVAQEEIENEVTQIRKNIRGDPKNTIQSLEQVLAFIGSNINEFKKSVKHSIALEKYFNNKLDDNTLKKYFKENKSVFNGESVKVSHILIDTRKMKTKEELSHAQEQIKNIKKEIDDGADFNEIARKYSNCPSAINGGDLGYIQRKGNFAKQFLDTAFSLGVDQASEPVQTEYGYHLIKVTDKKEGSNVQFEDVRKKVRLEALDAEILKLLDRLREEAQIVVSR
ncbi:MAG: peptidylprolyl isomerase [Planctomycetota bacterium]|nr:peptidylprolyl isomerase [Planctomycetota bacterium]